MYVMKTLDGVAWYATCVAGSGKILAWSRIPAGAERLTRERCAKVSCYYSDKPSVARGLRYIDTLPQPAPAAA